MKADRIRILERHREELKSVMRNAIEQDGVSGCWRWKYSVNDYGLPALSFRGIALTARPVMWFLKHGEYPSFRLTSACSERTCVRPSHLKIYRHKCGSVKSSESTRKGAQHGDT